MLMVGHRPSYSISPRRAPEKANRCVRATVLENISDYRLYTDDILKQGLCNKVFFCFRNSSGILLKPFFCLVHRSSFLWWTNKTSPELLPKGGAALVPGSGSTENRCPQWPLGRKTHVAPRPSQYGMMDRALGQTKPKLPRTAGIFVIVFLWTEICYGWEGLDKFWMTGWGFGTTKRPGRVSTNWFRKKTLHFTLTKATFYRMIGRYLELRVGSWVGGTGNMQCMQLVDSLESSHKLPMMALLDKL